MDSRFQAVMLLHALGDTIGFKNGEWEFNHYNFNNNQLDVLEFVNDLIYEFIALGGINGIDLEFWKVSDDTFFHIAIGKSLLKYKNKVDEKFLSNVKYYLKKEADRMIDEASGNKLVKFDKDLEPDKFDRFMGITTANSIKKFTDTFDARHDKYDSFAGGNGAAMRSLVIGMCFQGEKNRDKLMDISVTTSMLTHNNAVGYLAGYNAALFTALAFEGVPIKTWPIILLTQLSSTKWGDYTRDEIIRGKTFKDREQMSDHANYLRQWNRYVETKFDANLEPVRNRSFDNPMHRIRYFYDNFFRNDSNFDLSNSLIGSSGFLCMIMAYDALLDCDGKWEKLVVYSMLHSGDSDTVGAVAGGLYGAVYGFGDVPENMLKHLERRKELEKLADALYEKYHN